MTVRGFRFSLQMMTGPLVAALAVVAVFDSVTQSSFRPIAPVEAAVIVE